MLTHGVLHERQHPSEAAVRRAAPVLKCIHSGDIADAWRDRLPAGRSAVVWGEGGAAWGGFYHGGSSYTRRPPYHLKDAAGRPGKSSGVATRRDATLCVPREKTQQMYELMHTAHRGGDAEAAIGRVRTETLSDAFRFTELCCLSAVA